MGLSNHNALSDSVVPNPSFHLAEGNNSASTTHNFDVNDYLDFELGEEICSAKTPIVKDSTNEFYSSHEDNDGNFGFDLSNMIVESSEAFGIGLNQTEDDGGERCEDSKLSENSPTSFGDYKLMEILDSDSSFLIPLISCQTSFPSDDQPLNPAEIWNSLSLKGSPSELQMCPLKYTHRTHNIKICDSYHPELVYSDNSSGNCILYSPPTESLSSSISACTRGIFNFINNTKNIVEFPYDSSPFDIRKETGVKTKTYNSFHNNLKVEEFPSDSIQDQRNLANKEDRVDSHLAQTDHFYTNLMLKLSLIKQDPEERLLEFHYNVDMKNFSAIEFYKKNTFEL